MAEKRANRKVINPKEGTRRKQLNLKSCIKTAEVEDVCRTTEASKFFNRSNVQRTKGSQRKTRRSWSSSGAPSHSIFATVMMTSTMLAISPKIATMPRPSLLKDGCFKRGRFPQGLSIFLRCIEASIYALLHENNELFSFCSQPTTVS